MATRTQLQTETLEQQEDDSSPTYHMRTPQGNWDSSSQRQRSILNPLFQRSNFPHGPGRTLRSVQRFSSGLGNVIEENPRHNIQNPGPIQEGIRTRNTDPGTRQSPRALGELPTRQQRSDGFIQSILTPGGTVRRPSDPQRRVSFSEDNRSERVGGNIGGNGHGRTAPMQSETPARLPYWEQPIDDGSGDPRPFRERWESLVGTPYLPPNVPVGPRQSYRYLDIPPPSARTNETFDSQRTATEYDFDAMSSEEALETFVVLSRRLLNRLCSVTGENPGYDEMNQADYVRTIRRINSAAHGQLPREIEEFFRNLRNEWDLRHLSVLAGHPRILRIVPYEPKLDNIDQEMLDMYVYDDTSTHVPIPERDIGQSEGEEAPEDNQTLVPGEDKPLTVEEQEAVVLALHYFRQLTGEKLDEEKALEEFKILFSGTELDGLLKSPQREEPLGDLMPRSDEEINLEEAVNPGEAEQTALTHEIPSQSAHQPRFDILGHEIPSRSAYQSPFDILSGIRTFTTPPIRSLLVPGQMRPQGYPYTPIPKRIRESRQAESNSRVEEREGSIAGSIKTPGVIADEKQSRKQQVTLEEVEDEDNIRRKRWEARRQQVIIEEVEDEDNIRQKRWETSGPSSETRRTSPPRYTTTEKGKQPIREGEKNIRRYPTSCERPTLARKNAKRGE
ncbi:hypothetical protein D9758_007008 [Tetrapyrgos nigripes]|uniref:Uncharacterized protein n=1 Tax=Tetrapyrgos nigripes TaxID=182062 RepID=A0A8H5GSU4_9AGAR|nr:hypothetical protein D9758_007008 [Tetrapyrgos nigripes]